MIKALTDVFLRVAGSGIVTTVMSSPVAFGLTKISDVTFTSATVTIAGLATAAALLTEGVIKPKNDDRCVDAVLGAMACGTLLVLATNSSAMDVSPEIDAFKPIIPFEMRLD